MRTFTSSRPAPSATPATASHSCAGAGGRPATTSRCSRPATRRITGMWRRSTARTLTDGVVLDIGGGSMQLIQVEDRHGARRRLVPGRRRADDRIVPVRRRPQPPGTQEGPAAAARSRRVASSRRRGWLAGRGGRLVGTGGAVRNLAAAAQRAQFGASGGIDIGIQGFVVSAAALDELVDTLAALPVGERRTLPGIKPGRGDIILAAAVTLQTVLESGGFDGHRGDGGRPARRHLPRPHDPRRGGPAVSRRS